MANRFLVPAGGDWTTDASWSTTDGGAPDTIAPTASDDVFLTANSGQCTISAASVGKSLTCTGYTNTLTHNAFTLTISGSVTFVAGMTYTPLVTSQLTIAATGTLTTAGKLIPLLALTSGTLTLGDNLSFMASKVMTFTLSGNGLNLNGKTISGNSSINRVCICSNSIGTSRTVTANGGTFANADFRDINMSSPIDLSGITGFSGNCGGNTNITFTTAETQTWSGTAGGSWSLNAWTTRVPLPQDDVNMGASFIAGRTIAADMPRLGRSIDWTGATNSPTFDLTVSGITTMEVFGSLTLISNMTVTADTARIMTFMGRSSFTITSAGKAFGGLSMSAFGGTYTLQDALTWAVGSSTVSFTITAGTLITNGFSVTGPRMTITGSIARTITLGSSNVTVSGTGTAWNVSGSNVVVNSDTSTISVTDVSGTVKTFAGLGLTYYNLSIAGSGSGTVTISGSNTFNRIIVSGGTKSIILTGSTTQTLLSGEGLGNGSNLITFTSSAGSATVSKSTGIVSWNFVSLTNIPSTGGATFYAGASSNDGGGNTGWLFVNAPDLDGTSGQNASLLMLLIS